LGWYCFLDVGEAGPIQEEIGTGQSGSGDTRREDKLVGS